MPLYEYRCLSCNKHIEVIQKFSDAPLTECEECQGILEKQVSLSSFSLKGTGWYSTDYKRPPAPAATEPAEKAAAPADATKATETKATTATPAPTTPVVASNSTPASSTSST